MKTILIINCIVALANLILVTEIAETAKAEFKKDYPTAKFNEVSTKAKIIGWVSVIVRALIPIYNLICLTGFLFMRETMIDKGYEQLMDRMVN